MAGSGFIKNKSLKDAKERLKPTTKMADPAAKIIRNNNVDDLSRLLKRWRES